MNTVALQRYNPQKGCITATIPPLHDMCGGVVKRSHVYINELGEEFT